MICLFIFCTKYRVNELILLEVTWTHKKIQTKNKTETSYRCFCFSNRRRPTFPGSHPPSIISAEELNFCVRYGNRCDLFAIVTRSLSCVFSPDYSSPFPLPVLTYYVYALLLIGHAPLFRKKYLLTFF